MVEVLNTSGGIDTDRLQFAAGAWADPDRLPCRRDHERSYPFEAVFAANEFSVGIKVFEAFSASSFPPPPFRTPVAVDRSTFIRNSITSFSARLRHKGEDLCTRQTLCLASTVRTGKFSEFSGKTVRGMIA